ncbi:MAG: glycosyltransferase family 4 protein [Planctomycetes bacterium]|nr:glycosyltransferase family 4 protein [Planctomycetota bacterium]
MHIAIITAGSAGMFCGSCMHDNTLAHALRERGVEVSLIPTYTPIRVDEQNMSIPQVFFGGINVYMDYRSRLWRAIPRVFTRWLDKPGVINLVTKFGINSDAKKLGDLTVAMMQGEAGPQHREVEELVTFICDHLKPDVVCFSNALLVGALRSLKQRYDGKVFCLLQGDDIFLEDLPEPHKGQAIQLISERAQEFDGFLTHSIYYRDFMTGYLNLPAEKFHIVPLGIDLKGHDGRPHQQHNEQFTVGYFARICPEKGLHCLVEAFRLLHQKHPNTRLVAGGYLGKRDERYFQKIQKGTRDLGAAFEYAGSPETHDEKVALIKSFDVLSVPTVYHEPKGLYVLEALANGVPVVQPRHGAFPELIEATGGGLLVEPDDPRDLANSLEELLTDSKRRMELATTGRKNVFEKNGLNPMALATLAVFNGAVSK